MSFLDVDGGHMFSSEGNACLVVWGSYLDDVKSYCFCSCLYEDLYLYVICTGKNGCTECC